jgi:hypothetical protein
LRNKTTTATWFVAHHVKQVFHANTRDRQQ